MVDHAPHHIVLTLSPLDEEHTHDSLNDWDPSDLVSHLPSSLTAFDDISHLASISEVHISADYDDLTLLLDRIRNRRRDCRSYLLEQDIVIHLLEVDLDLVTARYARMIADGVLILPST